MAEQAIAKFAETRLKIDRRIAAVALIIMSGQSTSGRPLKESGKVEDYDEYRREHKRLSKIKERKCIKIAERMLTEFLTTPNIVNFGTCRQVWRKLYKLSLTAAPQLALHMKSMMPYYKN